MTTIKGPWDYPYLRNMQGGSTFSSVTTVTTTTTTTTGGTSTVAPSGPWMAYENVMEAIAKKRTYITFFIQIL